MTTLLIILICILLICIALLPKEKKENHSDKLWLGDYRVKGLIDNAMLLRMLKKQNDDAIKMKKQIYDNLKKDITENKEEARTKINHRK